MGLKTYKIPPSYGHPPYQGGQGGSSAKRIVSLIVTSYLLGSAIAFLPKDSQKITDKMADIVQICFY
jgi:hypothetical protein